MAYRSALIRQYAPPPGDIAAFKQEMTALTGWLWRWGLVIVWCLDFSW